MFGDTIQKPERSESYFKDANDITFDNITGEHNYKNFRFLTLANYVFMLVGFIMQFLFIASDVYTLIQIYAEKNWDSSHEVIYIPILAYKVVFTACIGISFVYFLSVWFTGVITQRRKKVVSSYLNTYARLIDSLSSYNKFCIFDEIETKSFGDWYSLRIYTAYHYEVISWLFADTPRQLLNGVTIGYVISDRFTSGNIIQTISTIAETNIKEAILLSLMTFSFIIWLFFTFIKVLLIVTSICVIPSVRRKNKMGFNKCCIELVAEGVNKLYGKKVKIHEIELSERRKIPTAVTEVDFNNETIDSSFESVKDVNPFEEVEYGIPSETHSKINLLNNVSTIDLQENRGIYTESEKPLYKVDIRNPSFETFNQHDGANNHSSDKLNNSFTKKNPYKNYLNGSQEFNDSTDSFNEFRNYGRSVDTYKGFNQALPNEDNRGVNKVFTNQTIGNPYSSQTVREPFARGDMSKSFTAQTMPEQYHKFVTEDLNGEEYVPSTVYDENYHKRLTKMMTDNSDFSRNYYQGNMVQTERRYTTEDTLHYEEQSIDNVERNIEISPNTFNNEIEGIPIIPSLDDDEDIEIPLPQSQPQAKRSSQVLYGSRTLL